MTGSSALHGEAPGSGDGAAGAAARQARPPREGVVAALWGVAFVASPWIPVIVVGPVLVPPILLTVVSATALLWALTRMQWRRTFTVWVGLATMAQWVGVLFLTAGVSLVRLGDDHLFLEPAGPDGCRVVARESSFLMAGSGRAGTVGRIGFARWTSSWTADDGVQPIASGEYTLTWEGRTASLALQTETTNPVWPDVHSFTC